MDTEIKPLETEGNPPLLPPLSKGGAGGFNRLSEKVSPIVLSAVGITVLLGAYGLHRMLRSRVLKLQTESQVLAQAQEQGALAHSHFQALADLKTHDVNQFKDGMSNLAQSTRPSLRPDFPCMKKNGCWKNNGKS